MLRGGGCSAETICIFNLSAEIFDTPIGLFLPQAEETLAWKVLEK